MPVGTVDCAGTRRRRISSYIIGPAECRMQCVECSLQCVPAVPTRPCCMLLRSRGCARPLCRWRPWRWRRRRRRRWRVRGFTVAGVNRARCKDKDLVLGPDGPATRTAVSTLMLSSLHALIALCTWSYPLLLLLRLRLRRAVPGVCGARCTRRRGSGLGRVATTASSGQQTAAARWRRAAAVPYQLVGLALVGLALADHRADPRTLRLPSSWRVGAQGITGSHWSHNGDRGSAMPLSQWHCASRQEPMQPAYGHDAVIAFLTHAERSEQSHRRVPL